MDKSNLLPTSTCLILTHPQTTYTSDLIKCTNSASFSAILTIAEYICVNFPDLTPPKFPHQYKPNVNNDTEEDKKIDKIYFQPWTDYFVSLLEIGNKYGRIVQRNGVVYFVCRIDQGYYQEVGKVIQNKFKHISQQQLEKLIAEAEQNQKQKGLHVGIINFSASQLINSQPLRPKVNLPGLFTGIWFRHGDIWRKYNVLNQDYPTQEQILKTDVFILSGSTLSVNDNDPRVEKTMQILLEGLKKNKKLKILGLCFGHQAFAKYFGGQVSRKDTYSGIEVVKFKQDYLGKFPILSQISQLNNDGYLMFQFHNDYVTKVPQGFYNLADSSSCQSQSMISQDGRCLTFQCHPEYTLGYIKDMEIKMTRMAKKAKHQGPPPTYKPRFEALAQYGIQRHLQSVQIIRQTIRRFIEYKIE